MSLNDTPRGSRLHIGIFGRRNSGKSSLINALTGHDIALVSDTPGTTTDPVFKSMELHPIGPVVFIDTAGFDDMGSLGKLRVQRTEEIIDRTDIGIIVIDGSELNRQAAEGTDQSRLSYEYERQWIKSLEEKNVPVIIALNKCDKSCEEASLAENSVAEAPAAHEKVFERVRLALGEHPLIAVSAVKKTGLDLLREAIARAVPEDFLRQRILSNMIEEGGLALLVMPQDIQAPKGRLILPQVQTLRELLDKKCTAVSTTVEGLERALKLLGQAPDLIITDSQCFDTVYEKKPASSELTSFSVLFAAYKGDMGIFVKGASALDDMTEKSRVLIAEACTHVPLSEDIGREKIPRLLHKKFGPGIEVVNVCGNDFPRGEELRGFDLVIHCGACMFNRRHVINRIAEAEAAGVPITNYGVVLAKLSGILDKIKLPK